MTTNAQRPIAQRQRTIIGRATLLAAGTEVDIVAKGVCQMTGNPFYIVGGPRPFGVWPDEIKDLRYAQPVTY